MIEENILALAQWHTVIRKGIIKEQGILIERITTLIVVLYTKRLEERNLIFIFSSIEENQKVYYENDFRSVAKGELQNSARSQGIPTGQTPGMAA